MHEFFNIFSIFLVAMVKYFYAPFFAYATGESFWVSVITIILGGISSFSFFYYISTFIVISTKFIKPLFEKIIPEKIYDFFNEKKEIKKDKKRVFTKRNKRIVKMKHSGMFLIILTTPVLLSLPVGAFLLKKYFHGKGAYWGALFAIIVEGFIISLLIWKVSLF